MNMELPISRGTAGTGGRRGGVAVWGGYITGVKRRRPPWEQRGGLSSHHFFSQKHEALTSSPGSTPRVAMYSSLGGLGGPAGVRNRPAPPQQPPSPPPPAPQPPLQCNGTPLPVFRSSSLVLV